MVPVEINGNDSWGLLANIMEDRKIVIFNPFYPHMHDLSGDATALEKVG
jgi:hypothetical protein